MGIETESAAAGGGGFVDPVPRGREPSFPLPFFFFGAFLLSIRSFLIAAISGLFILDNETYTFQQFKFYLHALKNSLIAKNNYFKLIIAFTYFINSVVS